MCGSYYIFSDTDLDGKTHLGSSILNSASIGFTLTIYYSSIESNHNPIPASFPACLLSSHLPGSFLWPNWTVGLSHKTLWAFCFHITVFAHHSAWNVFLTLPTSQDSHSPIKVWLKCCPCHHMLTVLSPVLQNSPLPSSSVSVWWHFLFSAMNHS